MAKRLGGKRIPVTGIDRNDRDVETARLFVQCKFRKSIPPWLDEWLDGICLAAKGAGKTGCLVMAQPGTDVAQALVVMRMEDFEALHGKLPPIGQRKEDTDG